MNRRTFLEASAAGLAYSSIAPTAADIANGPTKRVALIGTGWYGKVDLLRLIQVAPVEVVALADVDSTMLSGAADIVAKRQKSGKRPKTYGDYRTLLKENKLDIVLIGTPDHWHALPMIAAVKAGCDVYVQKPTSIDVVESQAMLAAARKYNRVVQVGTQRRSTPHLMEAREQIVAKGLLGNVAHAEVCCYYHMRNRSNPADSHPPANLDYDMWSGPAPRRPYSELCHPRTWRAFTEYSNGIVGDMCVHMLDTVRWMLDLGWPSSIVSQGQHHRHTDSMLRLRRPAGRLAAPRLGPRARPGLPVGGVPLRRQGHAEIEREQLRLHPARRRGQASTSRRQYGTRGIP